jgi:alpha-tubulin suppressor-like RCC1 family protein
MPVSYPYTQYTGIWKLNSASAAQGAGTWPVPPSIKLYSWGDNTYGQLGLNNTTSYSSPKQISSDIWSSVSSFGRSRNTLAIKTNGTLWSWGLNDFGQLGLGNTINYSSPKQIGALTGWLKVSCGNYTGFAIKTNGTMWVWGGDPQAYGTLGLGNTTSYSSPKQLGSLTNWSGVASGFKATIAVKTDGTLWTWGNNIFGSLGLNNTTNYSSPKQVGALTSWLKVACGYANMFAIKTDGTLWAWGDNVAGQLGLGNTNYYSSPKQVGSLTNWSSISVGTGANRGYSLSTKTDGTLWSWGPNQNGRLGLGNTTTYSSPKQVGSLTTWSVVSAGSFSSFAVTTNGTLYSWGQNSSGQLGLGNTTDYSSPKQVGALTTWQAIASGINFATGIAVN